MARKPSYDFERREREKAKATKAAERAQAKGKRKADAPEGDEPDTSSPAADKTAPPS